MALQTEQDKVVQWFKDKAAAMQDNAADVWQKTYEGDIDAISNVQLPACSIEMSEERMVAKIGMCSDYELTIIVHFRWAHMMGLENFKQYRYYVGLLKHALTNGHESDDNSIIDIVEDSSAPGILGQEAPHPGGTLILVAKYRTLKHDPYHKPGDVV